MPLKRITLATDTLQEFVALTPAKQKILIFILSRRNMHNRPTCPTNFFSYRDIAEETGISKTTVRLSVAALLREGWITLVSQRKKYTPGGKPETQYKWIITKVVHALEKTYQEDEAATEVIDPAADPNVYLYKDKLWRPGGALGWHYTVFLFVVGQFMASGSCLIANYQALINSNETPGALGIGTPNINDGRGTTAPDARSPSI